MRNYYIECEVKYNNDDEFNDSEDYSFIVQAKNKKEAGEIGKIKALNYFEDELGKDFETEILIIQLYKTSDDARSS